MAVDEPFININLNEGEGDALAMQFKVTNDPLIGLGGDALKWTWSGSSNEEDKQLFDKKGIDQY